MLATRSLRLAVSRCYSPAVYAWSVQTKTPLTYKQTTTWYTTPMAAAYSKDTKSDEPPLDQSAATSSTPECNKATSPPSSSSSSKSEQRGPLSDLDVKLPNRDQIEGFLFKALVYFSDFAFYIYALTRKFFEIYIVGNTTVQHYWKLLMKRMEEARKEIKSK